MSSKIQFYYNPFSRARTILWMLEEIGQPYDIKYVDLKAGEHKSPEFLKLNPMGKIPMIVHDGVVVTEAAAICTYLADRFPEARLAPAPTDARRGSYLRWMFFASGPTEYAMMAHKFPPKEAFVPSQVGFGTYEATISNIEKALSPGPFLLGDTFTAADLYMAALLEWAFFAKMAEPRPALTAFIEKAHARPAYQKARTIAAEYEKRASK